MEDLTREQKRRAYHREYYRASRSAGARKAAVVTQPGSTPGPATLADGFYQVQDGKPYHIACEPGDVFHVDPAGGLVPGPGPKRRTAEVRG